MYLKQALVARTILAMFTWLIGCNGEVGPQGPQGTPGPQGNMGVMGEAGKGWTESGNDVLFGKAGNVGIGTDKPQAKLHVNGSLNVEEDASLLPAYTCKSVVLDNPALGDLGEQLQSLTGRYRCLWIVLKKGTSWEWNKVVNLLPNQRVDLTGEDYWPEGPSRSGVYIRMTKNEKFLHEGIEYRSVARIRMDSGSKLTINGIGIRTEYDPRPITPSGLGSSLIINHGQGAHVVLRRFQIDTAEMLISFLTDGSVGSALFFGGLIKKVQAVPTDVSLIRSTAPGWDLGPCFGFVGHAGVTLGPGVSFPKDPNLTYSPPLP